MHSFNLKTNIHTCDVRSGESCGSSYRESRELLSASSAKEAEED